MGRARKVFVAACVVSLLIHLGLMGMASDWWTMPREEVPFPLEARLELAQSPARPPEPAAKPSGKTPRKTLRKAPAPSVGQPIEPVPNQPPMPTEANGAGNHDVEAAPALSPAPAGPPEPMPEPPPQTVSPQEEPPPPPSPPPRRMTRMLPEKLVLVYNVLAGEGGFNLGQATYTWLARNARYSLVSVAEAKGLASLFMSGRIVQTSEGRIGAAGLVPEQFWLAKNERRLDTARFDWERMQLVLPQGGEPLRDNTQDLLSFPFHLAMTVAEGGDGWILPVTNGRKLKGYRFTLLGRVNLEVGKESLETLHVQGSRAGDGSLDVWLAPERHWLPVRIRTQDQKGRVMELTLDKLTAG